MNYLVTVIITTYKRSDKIENALKSVVNQTYNNIEIIVVDDNADYPDERKKTKAIVKKYKEVILIENKKNLGGALSRNEGIYKAQGQFISFLDDDDEYSIDKVEKQINLFLEKNDENPGLIFCNEKDIDYNKNIIYQQMMGCIAPTSFWLVPKKVLQEINYFEDTPCKQDSIVLLKILLQGYNVFKVNDNLVVFNEHDNESGISGTKISNIAGLVNYRKWCRRYYDRLDNRKQVNDIECNFSRQLITLYIINKKKKEAASELMNIFKRRPFSKYVFKSLFKLIFTSMYLKKIGVK